MQPAHANENVALNGSCLNSVISFSRASGFVQSLYRPSTQSPVIAKPRTNPIDVRHLKRIEQQVRYLAVPAQSAAACFSIARITNSRNVRLLVWKSLRNTT